MWRATGYAQTPLGRRKVSRKRKRQGDAIKARDEAIAQLENPRPVPDNITLSEYFPDWLQTSARASVAHSTYVRYEQIVRVSLIPVLGDIQLARLSPADIRRLKQTLLDKGQAPATVRKAQEVLSTALNQAVSDGLIALNPSSKVKKAKERGEKMRTLSAEQAARLIASVEGTRYEALYLLALKLGPRQGELLALLWENLDTNRGALSITLSVDTHEAGSRWGPTKTGEGRTLKLPESVLDSLVRHRKIQLEERLVARSWDDEKLIFPNRSGRVMRRNQLAREFHKHLDEAGLPRIRFHDLRHTSITLMLQSGIPVPTVSQIAGHKNPTQTLGRYSHVLPGHQDEAAKIMDAYDF